MSRNEHSDFIREADNRKVFSAQLARGSFSAARVAVGFRASERLTDPHPLEDAFLIAYQSRDYDGELWVDGKHVPIGTMVKGSFTFYDYRRQWQANLLSEFDCLNFHVPRKLINGLIEEEDGRPIDTLILAPGKNVHDVTLQSLSEAMIASVGQDYAPSPLLLDQIALAFCMHLAATYGNRSIAELKTGGLAPWQARLATEFLSSAEDEALSIKAAAAHCGLSQTYFVRAFKTSFHMTPHQWLTRMRLERAKTLLKDTDLPIAQVAAFSGFSDNSYFTRVFAARVGVSPSQFRRRLRA